MSTLVRMSVVLVCLACIAQGQKLVANPPSKMTSPPKAKVENVIDDYHGHKVTDPYRWLENSTSPDTQRFVEEQNAYTRQILDAVPGRDKLRPRIEQLVTIGSVGTPRVRGHYYFSTRREGHQNQPIIYVREGLHGKDRTLVDVNALAPDGTIALDWWFPNHDGKYVAYGTSPNGSELSTLRVIETDSGKLLSEQLDRTRGASVAWLPNNSGFYYTRYPRRGDVPAGQELYNRHVFFHQLGVPGNENGSKDPLIFGEGLDPEHWPNVTISEDGRWLLVHISEGWTKSELLLKDLADANSKFVTITSGKDFQYIGSLYDGNIYITTNEDAPRERVFKVPCAKPERANWKEIVPQSDRVIENSNIIGRRLFVQYFKNAISSLSVYDLNGQLVGDVPMPGLGSIGGLSGDWNGTEGFFGFTSYALPFTVYQVSLDGKTTAEWMRVNTDIDARQYEVKQLWFNSKDGTRVPMFVVHKRGLKLNSRNPVLLSGYGGFNLGRTPAFNRNAMLLLLEHGGVYADVQLRGGNEFGEEWHRAGMLDKKQNVFDDFIAAAEYLIAQKYTDKDHLAIQGGSNGGLLMGAVLTQRPDLFRAVVCQVPLLDMLRYQKFQIAKLWIPEYGTAEDPKQFDWIYAYSPYQHVKPGTVYPAVFFMTADSDTRVDPMHAKKMAALLQAQALNGPDRPILLRVDTKAGHGIGKPVGKIMEDDLDVWSFVFSQLGIH
ncbi:MAG TPA: prolyl oligopeptidase family serine peptidase [Candidatus Angelobacter sp.]|jgi:prolyl oligopeptidase|nr:prolyl oligopeptidase family serine peptidase [Candidatus Angelobacter sp.]